MYNSGVYVMNTGNLIKPAMMLQSLVEHLDRWSKAVGIHGICILEAGQLPAKIAGECIESCVSLAFDGC